MKKYVCTVCGFIYEGDLEEVSDDYKCPVCDMGKEVFEEVKE